MLLGVSGTNVSHWVVGAHQSARLPGSAAATLWTTGAFSLLSSPVSQSLAGVGFCTGSFLVPPHSLLAVQLPRAGTVQPLPLGVQTAKCFSALCGAPRLLEPPKAKRWWGIGWLCLPQDLYFPRWSAGYWCGADRSVPLESESMRKTSEPGGPCVSVWGWGDSGVPLGGSGRSALWVGGRLGACSD